MYRADSWESIRSMDCELWFGHDEAAASWVIPAGGAPRRMDRSLCPANMMAGRWAGGRSVEEATSVSLFSTGIRRHERVQWCSRVTSRHVLPVHLSPVIISKLWLSDEWVYIIFKCMLYKCRPWKNIYTRLVDFGWLMTHACGANAMIEIDK